MRPVHETPSFPPKRGSGRCGSGYGDPLDTLKLRSRPTGLLSFAEIAPIRSPPGGRRTSQGAAAGPPERRMHDPRQEWAMDFGYFGLMGCGVPLPEPMSETAD